MATHLASDFKVYPEQFRGGVIERLTQASSFFNAASMGAIVLSTVSRRGDYVYESFLQSIANLVTRRDTTSISAATKLGVSMEEFISVKLNRKIGPVDQTLDSFRKVLMASDGPEALSFLIGTQVAKAMEVEMLNTALRATRAALDNVSTNTFTIAASGTMTSAALNSGLALFGDAYSNVSVWVMHSKVFFDLVGYQIDPSNHGDNIAGVVVQGANPATFGRPVIVTDSSALIIDVGTSSAPVLDYYTLGLTPGAVAVENSEGEHITYDEVTGLENLVARLQGEYAYNLGQKGFQWDVANGGANPIDSAIGTGSNWDKVATDHKDLGGIVIQSR
jgi:hypothetical protein